MCARHCQCGRSVKPIERAIVCGAFPIKGIAFTLSTMAVLMSFYVDADNQSRDAGGLRVLVIG
jgi:hypothetical protein